MAKKIVQPVEVQASVKGDSSVKSFKAQIKEAQQEALRLAAAFGETDARTIAAAKRVAELKDRMEDVNATIQGLHPDKFQAIANITGTLANGFAAAQGAAALLGGESEDLQKAMLRVQGAMAFAQGVAGLKDLQFQFASLGKMVTDAFTTMKAAIGSTGIGALLIALGAAVTYVAMNWKELTGQLSDSEKAAKAAANVMREGAASVEKQRIEIGYYQKIINDTNKSEQERITAFNKLKELVPTLTDNEINNAAALKNTNAELTVYLKNAVLRAQLDALIAKQAENNNKIAELQSKDVTKEASVMQKAWNYITAGMMGPGATMRAEMANIEDGIKNVGTETKTLTEENKALEASMKAIQDQLLATDKATADAAAAAAAAAAEEEKRKQQKEAQRKKAEEDAKKAEEQRKQDLVNLREREVAMTELEADGLGKRQRLFGLAWQQRLKELKEKGYSEIEIQKIWQAEMDKIRTTWEKEQAAKQKSLDDLMKSDREKALQAELEYINNFYAAKELLVLQEQKDAEGNVITEEQRQAKLKQIRLDALRDEIRARKDVGQSAIEQEKEYQSIQNEIAKTASEQRANDLKKEAEARQRDIEMGVNAAQTMVSLFDALTTNSNAKTEEERKKEFERKKSYETVAAIISTIGAAQAAYASQIIPGEPSSVVRASVAAAIATAQGMARVAAIRKQQYQTGAPSGSGAGPGSLAAQRPSMPGSASSLGGGSQFAGQEATRVYVTEGDITQTQRRVKMLKSGSVI